MLLFSCYSLFHQTVLIAIDVNKAAASQLKTGFGVPFRIKFDKIQPISRHIGNKRYVMTFFHRMVDGNKVLVFNLFYTNFVLIVRRLGFKGRQSDTATTDYSLSARVNYVTADRAHIKL